MAATIGLWVATLRAHMMPDGVEQALADADLALHQLSPDSGWRPAALVLRGTAHALLGATGGARATEDLAAAVNAGLAGAAAEVVILAQAQLALLAANQGAWGEAARRARAAQALVEDGGPRRLLDKRARVRGDGARCASRGETGGCAGGAGMRAPSAAAFGSQMGRRWSPKRTSCATVSRRAPDRPVPGR